MSVLGGFASLQAGIQANTSGLGLPGAFGAVVGGNAALTTTALNLILVANGQPQGLVKTMSVDEQFNVQRVKAIGSAIDIAFLPGVYEATFTLDKAYLYGQTLEVAFGGGIRPVIGKYLSNPDFTAFYFNIVAANANGVAIAVYHDCVITSVRKTFEIDQVTIMENCAGMVRWTDQT